MIHIDLAFLCFHLPHASEPARSKGVTIMRESGILMHITSLPGPYGVGTMGAQAYAFVDFLKKSGQKAITHLIFFLAISFILSFIVILQSFPS